MSSIAKLLTAFFIFHLAFTVARADDHVWRMLSNSRAYTIKINPQNKNTLYFGNSDDRVLRSYDAGKTWDTLLVGSGGSGSHLSTFHICRSDTNTLLVGGWVYQGIKRSVDGGKTWDIVLSDPTQARIWFLSEAIVEDPHSPNTLYVCRGQVHNEIYRSMDCGATFELMSTIPNNITTRLHTIQIRPDSTNILYVGCQSGVICRSDDSGRTWHPVPVNGKLLPLTSDAEVPKIVFSKTNPQIGYAIVTISNPDAIEGNGGVFKTLDGGATWNRIAFSDTSFWAVEIHPTDGREDVWVGGFRTWTLPSVIKGDSIVRRSTDGGSTWLNYDDVPWANNEQGEVVANAWVIRYDTLSTKLYLSTESGLYVLEQPVSVENPKRDEISENPIRIEVDDNSIIVRSLQLELEQLEFYTILGSLQFNIENIHATTHNVPIDVLPTGVVFVVATLADGMKVVRPVLIDRR